jgi:hypothetical protein
MCCDSLTGSAGKLCSHPGELVIAGRCLGLLAKQDKQYFMVVLYVSCNLPRQRMLHPNLRVKKPVTGVSGTPLDLPGGRPPHSGMNSPHTSG